MRRYCSSEVIWVSEYPRDGELANGVEDVQSARYDKNYFLLPSVAKGYQHSWFNIRVAWVEYLKALNRPPGSLLQEDGLTLNDEGERLYADLLTQFLKTPLPQPVLDPYIATNIQTVLTSAQQRDTTEFVRIKTYGNRLDLLRSSQSEGTVPGFALQIEGRDPDQFTDLWGFTRGSEAHSLGWPGVLGVRNYVPLVEEDWILTVTDYTAEQPPITNSVGYVVEGSRSGFIGRSVGTTFALAGQFEAWGGAVTLEEVTRLTGIPPPLGFEVRFRSYPYFWRTLERATSEVGDPYRTLFVSRSNLWRNIVIEARPGTKIRDLLGFRSYARGEASTLEAEFHSEGIRVEEVGRRLMLSIPMGFSTGYLESTLSLTKPEWRRALVWDETRVGNRVHLDILEVPSGASERYFRWVRR